MDGWSPVDDAGDELARGRLRDGHPQRKRHLAHGGIEIGTRIMRPRSPGRIAAIAGGRSATEHLRFQPDPTGLRLGQLFDPLIAANASRRSPRTATASAHDASGSPVNTLPAARISPGSPSAGSGGPGDRIAGAGWMATMASSAAGDKPLTQTLRPDRQTDIHDAPHHRSSRQVPSRNTRANCRVSRDRAARRAVMSGRVCPTSGRSTHRKTLP